MDCLEAMKNMADNEFDLAVVDPPYGCGFTEGGGNGGWFAKYHQSDDSQPYNRFLNPGSVFEKYKRSGSVNWDVAPPQEYFEQLFRVSQNQIIWGGNYFSLPPTRCFLIWRKLTISENFSMAMAEYAWTSFKQNAKVFECAPQDPTGKRFHPTQKPVKLYSWIFQKYAEPGMKILDTHLESGSSRIAAYDAGLDFVGYEIDKEYFNKQEERFADYTSQLDLYHV